MFKILLKLVKEVFFVLSDYFFLDPQDNPHIQPVHSKYIEKQSENIYTYMQSDKADDTINPEKICLYNTMILFASRIGNICIFPKHSWGRSLFVACYTVSRFLPEDIKSKDTFLVAIMFEKKNMKCPSCFYYKKNISKVPMNVKMLSFNEDTDIAIRFFQFRFPSFVVRHNLKSYVVNPDNIDDLVEIVQTEKWKKYKPVNRWVDIDSFFSGIAASLNPAIFCCIHIMDILSYYISGYVANFLIMAIISYLLISIYKELQRSSEFIQRKKRQ